jgi:hypothetical protein
MSNQSSKSPEYTLGTLEFCAALNGDDPELVRVVLQKFIRLVRRERRLAFLVDESSPIQDEEEEDTRDDGEEDVKYDDDHTHLQQTPTKKPKLESWKLDSKAYNVPFVGTSIQKGSEGTVVKNEWPTGFVQAYLEVSPQAQELIHSMKHFVPSHEFFTIDSPSKRKYSQTLQLQILYIQAFGEFLTCAMPREQVVAIEYFSSASSSSTGKRRKRVVEWSCIISHTHTIEGAGRCCNCCSYYNYPSGMYHCKGCSRCRTRFKHNDS